MTEEMRKIPEFISKCRVGDVPLIMLFPQKEVFIIIKKCHVIECLVWQAGQESLSESKNKKIAHILKI